MNEKIKEFLEEATEIHDHWHYGHSYDMVDHKMFAELIIRECISLLPYECQAKNGCHTSYVIAEHFGVKL